MVRKKLILLFSVLVGGAAVALITNVRFTPATADGTTPELSMIVIGKCKAHSSICKIQDGVIYYGEWHEVVLRPRPKGE